MAGHLTLAERVVLQSFWKRGFARSEVAQLMNRHVCTIYRELNRNSGARGYRAQHAQRMAEDRRQASRRPCKLVDSALRHCAAQRLKEAWSPDQIAGRMRLDHASEPESRVCATTIYNGIGRRSFHWRKWLRRGGLLTLVERKCGLVRIGKVANFYSTTAMQASESCLKDLPCSLRRSATFDSGREYAKHRLLKERLGLKVYFAEPYRLWHRGAGENLNGLLQQFFSKDTDFNSVSRGESPARNNYSTIGQGKDWDIELQAKSSTRKHVAIDLVDHRIHYEENAPLACGPRRLPWLMTR
jgi:IS30 family transposase